MSYETAPATVMLATNCAACGRALVDAISVNTGIGPDCRRKYGFDVLVTEAARAEANVIVHKIAMEQSGMSVAVAAERLRVLGFDKLADVVIKRTAKVRITIERGTLIVVTPYSERFMERVRSIKGRRWDAARKVNTFPEASRSALYDALLDSFAGLLGVGPRGPFRLLAMRGDASQV